MSSMPNVGQGRDTAGEYPYITLTLVDHLKSTGVLDYMKNTIHHNTLRYVTLCYVLRYVTLRYVTLRYVTLRYTVAPVVGHQ